MHQRMKDPSVGLKFLPYLNLFLWFPLLRDGDRRKNHNQRSGRMTSVSNKQTAPVGFETRLVRKVFMRCAASLRNIPTALA